MWSASCHDDTYSSGSPARYADAASSTKGPLVEFRLAVQDQGFAEWDVPVSVLGESQVRPEPLFSGVKQARQRTAELGAEMSGVAMCVPSR